MTDEEFDYSDPTAGFDLEQDKLQKQLLMAQALRRQPKAVGRQGGFGKALRSIAGHMGEWRAQAGMDDLAQQRRTTVSPQQRLELSLKKANLGKIQTQEAFDNAPASQLFHDLGKKFGFALPQGVTNSQAKEMLGMAERAYAADQRAQELRLNRSAMAGAKDDARAQRASDEVNKDVEALSKRLEAAPGMARDIGTLAGAAREKDIPGVGPIAGLLPDWLVSDEGKKVRQAARGVVRNTIHETSGTAASDSEVDRILGELGMGQTASEDAYRIGLEGLAGKTRALLRTKEAGYRPEAVQVGRQRGMTTSQDIPTYSAPSAPGAQAQDPGAAPPGMKWQKNKKTGERRLVPIGG